MKACAATKQKGTKCSPNPISRCQFFNPGHKVVGVAKARCRQAHVLFVRQGHALARGGVHLGGDGFIAHGEQEFFGRCARQRDQRQLALPGFANPALVGHFLQKTCALAFGIAPVQCGSNVERKDDDNRQYEQNEGTDNGLQSDGHGVQSVRLRHGGTRRGDDNLNHAKGPAAALCATAGPWVSRL